MKYEDETQSKETEYLISEGSSAAKHTVLKDKGFCFLVIVRIRNLVFLWRENLRGEYGGSFAWFRVRLLKWQW